MDWNALIDEKALGELITEDYSHLARPICEALAVFLAGLPAGAQRDILASQAALPSSAAASQRLAALAQQSPVLHKLGQTLARDQRLNPELRSELSALETLPSSVPTGTLRSMLEHELGSLDRLGVKLDSKPIAQASVAVVIGYRDATRRGVFKVLKSGIEERLQLELELLTTVGLYLDERCAQMGLPDLGYEDAFRQIKDKLRDEIRLDVEQANLALAAPHYAHCEDVQVPALHEHCTHRVTAMERVFGCKVTEHGLDTSRERNQLGSLIANSLLTHPMFSTRDDAMFHGDPHAGNLLCTSDGQLAILDWSLAGTLNKSDREAIFQILVGALMLDERRITEVLGTFADGVAPDPTKLMAVVRRRLHLVRSDWPPDIGWFVGLIDDAVERAGLRARADLLLFRKSLHMLRGVIADVGAHDRLIDQAIGLDFMRHLIAEWPHRWLTTLDSREFSTRLSNADLMQLMLSYPSAVGRFWLGSFQDMR